MGIKNQYINEKNQNLTFITGGTKSGKSEFAEYLAKKINDLTYIALSEKKLNDIHWQRKISIHKNRRPKSWALIETTDLLNTLSIIKGPLLIDSIGGFIMESINKQDDEWFKIMNSLIDQLNKRNNYTFIVGEQVGWSLVSEYKIGNTYIERIGELQKKITRISQENWLAINGRAIKIDDISLEIPN